MRLASLIGESHVTSKFLSPMTREGFLEIEEQRAQLNDDFR